MVQRCAEAHFLHFPSSVNNVAVCDEALRHPRSDVRSGLGYRTLQGVDTDRNVVTTEETEKTATSFTRNLR
jgi:hypothetical protein